jgi:hypothetical protein
MRLLAAVLVVLGVVAGVGVYFGVESFQGEETPKGGPEDLTPGPEFAQGSRDESDCIWATPPPYADTDEVICARECPECFPDLPPGPPEFIPCQEPQDTSLPLPAYESLERPDTRGWQRYESPNYPWSFLYPAVWKLDVLETTDLYGDVKGPVREGLKLWDPTAMEHSDDIRAPGAVRVWIDHGPRASGAGCAEGGRTEVVDVSLAAKPTLLVASVFDDPPVPRGELFYTVFAGVRVSDNAAAHFLMETPSADHLATMRALLESMTYGAAE